MRKILISSVLMLSLASGAAMAATKPASTKAATAATSADKAKTSDCAKQWKAEKKHSQTRKAFMAACTKS